VQVAEGDKKLLKELTEDRKSATNDAVRRFRNRFQEMTGILSTTPAAVDIAMFGRMLASNPGYTVEGAVQVGHAYTVCKTLIESDFFTAVDDLTSSDDSGSAHLGETEFSSGLYYTYVVIDRDLLKNNLGGDEELTKKAIAALIECVMRVSPSGKQNSFASRSYAAYALVEKGDVLPFSLETAFIAAVRGEDVLKTAISKLTTTLNNFEKTYGSLCDEKMEINAYEGTGSVTELVKFASE
jgi:CRISPR system Cascade subunit CasC